MGLGSQLNIVLCIVWFVVITSTLSKERLLGREVIDTLSESIRIVFRIEEGIMLLYQNSGCRLFSKILDLSSLRNWLGFWYQA